MARDTAPGGGLRFTCALMGWGDIFASSANIFASMKWNAGAVN